MPTGTPGLEQYTALDNTAPQKKRYVSRYIPLKGQKNGKKILGFAVLLC